MLSMQRVEIGLFEGTAKERNWDANDLLINAREKDRAEIWKSDINSGTCKVGTCKVVKDVGIDISRAIKVAREKRNDLVHKLCIKIKSSSSAWGDRARQGLTRH